MQIVSCYIIHQAVLSTYVEQDYTGTVEKQGALLLLTSGLHFM